MPHFALMIFAAVSGRTKRVTDGVGMDIQSDVMDNVHVSFLSSFCFTDKQDGPALRQMPARFPRLRSADTSLHASRAMVTRRSPS
jgi:hypothetical protein